MSTEKRQIAGVNAEVSAFEVSAAHAVLPQAASLPPAPPVQAPPVQAPPVQAPPVQAPPVQAPPVQAPPTHNPPLSQALVAGEARPVIASGLLPSGPDDSEIAVNPPPEKNAASEVVTGDQDKPLTTHQEEAALALVAHATHLKAAQALGVAESTLWRWRQLPAFQRRCREVRREVMTQAIGLLQASALESVEVLRAVAVDTQTPPGQRLAAARMTLDLAFRAVEIDDTGARIAELEDRLHDRLQEQAAKIDSPGDAV